MDCYRSISRRRNALACAALACGLLACGKSEPPANSEPAPAAAPLAQEPAAPPPATPAPAPAPEPAPSRPRYPRPGWSKVTADDQGPLCVYSGFVDQELTKFSTDAKTQKLKANTSVVFGSFGPWCVHEACDDLPSLQCSTTREGNTLLVHTHYWGYRKDGASCGTEVCRPVTAGCETQPLEAGEYTVKHGENTFKLKIPSTLRKPCFELKKK